MKQVYIHGLGQSCNSWNETLSALETSDEIVLIDLADMICDKDATYKNMYDAFSKKCNETVGQLDLCGLSLGGVLALNYAIDNPQKVHSLVLIAAQYKMPETLLRIQNFLFRFMPNSNFISTGFQKADFIQLCKTMMKLDFSSDVSKITCPTLVLYGEKDKANERASILYQNS